MKAYIKHWFWFMKQSYSFMEGRNKLWITLNGIPKAFKFAKDACEWNKMTPEQHEEWYASGEGRNIEWRD